MTFHILDRQKKTAISEENERLLRAEKDTQHIERRLFGIEYGTEQE